MFVDQFINPIFLESWESTEFWLVEKSLKSRLGHLCVKSNGQILGTVGLVLHIGSHTLGFWAGLHSVVRATNEKSPSRSGQSVRFFGLMSVSEMMGATEMRMKRDGKQEGRSFSTNTNNTHNGSGNSRSTSHSKDNRRCSSNALRGLLPERRRLSWEGRR